MGFGAILSIIKRVIDFIYAIPGWYADYVSAKARSDANERQKAIEDGVKNARSALTIEEKANAACKIEKALNPGSTCNVKPSDK